MKIATLTTHMADNYGAVLQAYALSTYLGKLGDCEILHYYPAYLEAAYHGKKKINGAKSLLTAVFAGFHKDARNRRSQRFAAFRQQHMKLSALCRTREELTAAAAGYDALVAGSDQIWNPDIHGFDENFFLTFCGEGITRHGYAPSFGVGSLTPGQAEEVQRRCAGFSRLAFREDSGVRIAKEVLGRECPLVLDPVFLLPADHWRGLKSQTAPTGKYVLCYFLSDPKGSVKAMCKRFQKEGYTVYSIGFSVRDTVNSAKKVYDLGPAEFLSYIDGAAYVLTDSFHATAFSMLFGKNFYTRVDGKNAKRADRVLTLLKAAGLEGRTYGDAEAETLPFVPIDGAAVQKKLAGAIEASRQYAAGLTQPTEVPAAVPTLPPVKCLENQSLAPYTTVKIGGVARRLLFPHTEEELAAVLAVTHCPYILGGGSNLLINDRREFDTVVCLREFRTDITPEGNGVYTVGAGVRLQKLITTINNDGYGGPEYLFSVPALVGGAVCMNAGRGGAHKKTLSEYILSVDVLRDGRVVTIPKADCGFGHRQSCFRHQPDIVVSARMQFPAQAPEEGARLREERLQLCREKQDNSAPNFGSVFARSDGRIMRLVRLVGLGKPAYASFSKKTGNWLLKGEQGGFTHVTALIGRVKRYHRLLRRRAECEVVIWE